MHHVSLTTCKTCAALQPPPGLGPADIATQSSICTGETIIGFRQPGTDRLLQAVVVHSPQDVADFYRSYGFSAPGRREFHPAHRLI